MDTRKRQWCDLPRTYEQFRREDTVDEMKGEYRCTIEQTEHMMELDNFLFGNSNKNEFRMKNKWGAVMKTKTAPLGDNKYHKSNNQR